MKNKSIFIAITTILVITIAGVGFYFIQKGREAKNNVSVGTMENMNNEETIQKDMPVVQEDNIQVEDDVVNISDWLTKKNDTVDFSFQYPQNAKIIDEGNCYRVEYGLGFVIFFLPIEGDMRCGARTGVGILPDNVDATDYLTIGGEKYEASGFNAVIDTKDEEFFKPETRYFYDFHHMFDLNKEENCGNAGGCERIGYGIYKEVSTPLSKESIDNTMDTLRAIVESVNVSMP